jgi:hypothetical protein
VSDERLIATTPSAPWLPAGSTAEVWAGADCAVPEPCIIVRLLLFRRGDPGDVEFFCVSAHSGLDLPTLPLGSGSGRLRAGEGVARLVEQMLGRPVVAYRCIGYVRNVVPHADADYPHPTPWAHVPVFTVGEGGEPVVEGMWVTLGSARPDLSVRHWWPIVEHHLTAAPEL